MKEFCIVSLCDFEQVKGFEMRSNVMKFWRFCDSTSSRVENKLKTNKMLTIINIDEKRVAVV